jgi:hypothetical protein
VSPPAVTMASPPVGIPESATLAPPTPALVPPLPPGAETLHPLPGYRSGGLVKKLDHMTSRTF